MPASGLPAPADRRSRNVLGPVCDRKRNGTAARFPPAARPQRSRRVPARGRLPGPLPPRGTKRDRRAGQPSPGGSGQVEARAPCPAPPRPARGSVPQAPRTYQEEQQRALRAPRHRASAASSPRPRARAPAPPRRPRPKGPLPGGGRSALPRGAAPGVASARKWSPEPDRAARAEVGMARRREAPGGRPPRAARAPGAGTPRAGNSETGPAPPPPLPEPLSAEGGRLPAPGAAVMRCAGWPRAGPRWRREGRATRGPVSSPRPPRGLLSGASSPGAKVLEPDSGGGLREGFSPPSHGPFPQVCRLSDSGRNSY